MIENIEELALGIRWNNSALQYYILLLFENTERKKKAQALLEKALSTDFSIKTIRIDEEESGFIPQGLYERLSKISKEEQENNPCVFVSGVDYEMENNLKLLNSYRDLFYFNFPIIFWLPAILEKKFMELAPDLFSLFGNNRYVIEELDTELSIDEIRETLSFFEKKYKMKSDEFYQKWLDGSIEDTIETHNWALTYQLLELADKNENQ